LGNAFVGSSSARASQISLLPTSDVLSKKSEQISPKICRVGGISPPPDPLPPVEATISDRKTAKEPEKISSRTSFWAKSGLPSFLIGPSHFICYHVHGGLNKHPY